MFTSDHALKLDWLPDWVAIIGSGYIGLEFSDVYTALGCDVTFVEVSTCCPVRVQCRCPAHSAYGYLPQVSMSAGDHNATWCEA